MLEELVSIIILIIITVLLCFISKNIFNHEMPGRGSKNCVIGQIFPFGRLRINNDNKITNVTFLNKNFLNLYIFFNKVYDDNNNNNNSLDLLCFLHIFKLIYNGVAGKTKIKLDFETDLKKIITGLPKSMYMRTAMFIRRGFKFNKKYWTKFAKSNLLTYIPKGQSKINKINEIINIKFPDWPNKEKDKFITHLLNDNTLLYIKNQSYFNGHWKQKFEPKYTKDGPFYIGDDKTVIIPMMTGIETEKLLTYQRQNLLFVSMPYKEDGYSMLIIIPEKPCNKKDLLDICINNLSADDITEFYNGKGKLVKYKKKIMPKFEFKTTWILNNSDNAVNNYNDTINNYAPFMKIILGNDINLQNISENIDENKSIHIESSSQISNDEKGTSVISETIMYASDSSYHHPPPPPPPLPILNIDKGFIWLIVKKINSNDIKNNDDDYDNNNNNYLICNIGMFVG